MAKWGVVAGARKVLEREQGYVTKDWGGRLPVALAYPNAYHLGMSNLGFQSVYKLFNAQPQVVCERLFWSGDARDPLVTLETQRDLLDSAVLAVSLSFELDYLNLLSLLHHAEMPVWSAERDETWPLLLAGGPAVTANPEPLSEICDAFVIGEAEELLGPLSERLYDMIDAPRAEVLEALAQFPGVYVPGRSPLPVQRQLVRNLDEYPTQTVIWTPHTEFGDMSLIEISRGCAHGCRFCLAGHTYRPFRERSLPALLAQAEAVRPYRDKVGLIGAAISDYTEIEGLLQGLRALDLKISVSSLRAKPLPEVLVAALAESGSRTLTLAPEAGSERLRRAVAKGIDEADILAAVELARQHRFPALKLYFMIGLPGESDEDARAIVDLVRAVQERFPGEVSINLTPFVPKAHTPFQWEAMAAADVLEARLASVQEALHPQRVQVKAEGTAWSLVQGVLARGDRRVGRALAAMGGQTSLKAWERALRSEGLEAREYLRQRDLGETLPWAVVETGVRRAFLERERGRAAEALQQGNGVAGSC